MTYELEFTSSEALTSLSVYVGGTLDDVDDLTGATEHAAVLSGGNLVATVELDVPSGTSAKVLRLVVDGAVITVGYLRPSAGGVKPSSPTTFSLSPSTYEFTLNVNGIVTVIDGIPSHDMLLGLADDDHTQYALADGSRGSFAATTHTHDDRYYTESEVDTALSGKSDTSHNHDGTYDPAGTASSEVAAHEADTTSVHGIADTSVLETTSGAQDKADAAEAAAIQRANHTGTQLASTISDLTEAIEDAVGAMATDGTTVNFTYDDVAGTLTAEVQGLTSADVSDFSEAVDDRVAALLTAGANITLTYDDTSGTLTIDASATGVTNLSWDAATSTVASDTGGDATLTAVDGANPGLMSVADKSKLDGIEAGATADQTGAEIKSAYEAEADTNAFTDAEKTKLAGVESGATADQTAADIRGLGFFDTSNDGTGSGLDADLLDGNEASAFAATGHDHDGTYALLTGEYAVNTVAASGATETLTLAPAHHVTMDQDCTFTFPTPIEDGHTFLLYVTGAFTPTFPASVDWDSATAPTYATPSLYGFTTLDGGTTWLGSLIASGLA